jgi:2-hydroxy-6-oxonona-2,4-dienedioate hydrolase
VFRSLELNLKEYIGAIEAHGEVLFTEYSAGQRMCWHRFGEGEPIVLLHGGHGSWLHWIRNVEALSKIFTLWIADMPGFGDSDSPSTELGVPEVAAIVGSSISSLIGPKAPVGLVGFSFGGMVATQIAVSRPNVRRLATVGVAGHGGVRRQPKSMVQWRGLSLDAETAALRHNLEALMLTPKNADDELALQIHRTCCYKTRFRSHRLSRRAPLPALLEKLSIPVHFIWGSEDVTAFPETIGPNFVGARQERKLTIVPGAGHWTQFEAPKEVDRTLIHWFHDTSLP